MNTSKQTDESLREAAAYGDEESVQVLVDGGADINSQHNLNGWTALHWAAKRGHSKIVQYLLDKGANPALKSLYGESAFAVAKNDSIRDLLSGSSDTTEPPKHPSLPITPSYISNPPLAPKMQGQDHKIIQTTSCSQSIQNQGLNEELVLKVRTSDPPHQDFIEIEVPLHSLTYENIFKIACDELQAIPQNVLKLRKLPNTILRKDKDVQRLRNFQELELVTIGPTKVQHYSPNISCQLEMNGDFRRSGLSQSPLASKSNYCKNGTILY